ncbi:DUF4041 domain-containing protein [Actinoplanes sp. NPDC049668]|uniref:DUF4041 domain-containing protein n=1 Tax=unclassified Actinoplanes TaxID=2626549 RepID=UPI0033A19321
MSYGFSLQHTTELANTPSWLGAARRVGARPRMGAAAPGWQLWVEEAPAAPAVPPPVVAPAPTSAASAPAPAQDADIPLFGARGKARELATEVTQLRADLERLRAEMGRLGVLSAIELEQYREKLGREVAEQTARAQAEQAALQQRLGELRQQIVVTEETALLQEAGVYQYRHPLSDAVAYQAELARLQAQIKAMAKSDGEAVLAASGWSVNGSEAQGRTMLRDYSKLMLRAYNAEADNAVRGLKPYKVDAAIERLDKVASTIARLGKTMDIRIAVDYHRLEFGS